VTICGQCIETLLIEVKLFPLAGHDATFRRPGASDANYGYCAQLAELSRNCTKPAPYGVNPHPALAALRRSGEQRRPPSTRSTWPLMNFARVRPGMRPRRRSRPARRSGRAIWRSNPSASGRRPGSPGNARSWWRRAHAIDAHAVLAQFLGEQRV